MYRMSVLQNQTSATPNNYFFETTDGQINILNISSLITTNIQLDDISMDCGYIGPASTATLLLNGVPVASVSSFTSSIVSWSQYPALAPITYTGGGGVANFTNVNAATNVSTLTANAQSLSVSSITGNVANFNNFTNVSTLTANVSSITGGVANFTNVNAATNISSLTANTQTLTVSSINGLAYPSTLLPVLSQATANIVAGINNFSINCTPLPPGFFLLTVTIQSGSGNDPFSCSAMLYNFGSATTGGCIHMPSISGAAPSLSNYVIIQDGGLASNVVSVIVGTTDAGTIGNIAQINVYRVT